MQIEDYLYQKKLYQPLTGKKPTEMKIDELKLLDRQALGVIILEEFFLAHYHDKLYQG
jgi:hypothetical protein